MLLPSFLQQDLLFMKRGNEDYCRAFCCNFLRRSLIQSEVFDNDELTTTKNGFSVVKWGLSSNLVYHVIVLFLTNFAGNFHDHVSSLKWLLKTNKYATGRRIGCPVTVAMSARLDVTAIFLRLFPSCLCIVSLVYRHFSEVLMWPSCFSASNTNIFS